MCGRFSLLWEFQTTLEHFNATGIELEWEKRYNIAPAEDILTIILGEEGPKAQMMQWGLRPPWKKEGEGFINARAETAFEKSSFKEHIRNHRALIPASGFMEWKKTLKGKEPYYFKKADDEVMAFAGIYEPQNLSASILTVPPNQLMKPIHDRMPAILQPEDEMKWLHKDASDDELKMLLKPLPDFMLSMHPLSKKVNDPKNKGAEVLEPLKEQQSRLEM
jgi:putative SOS response-associated peptidase YedK